MKIMKEGPKTKLFFFLINFKTPSMNVCFIIVELYGAGIYIYKMWSCYLHYVCIHTDTLKEVCKICIGSLLLNFNAISQNIFMICIQISSVNFSENSPSNSTAEFFNMCCVSYFILFYFSLYCI